MAKKTLLATLGLIAFLAFHTLFQISTPAQTPFSSSYFQTLSEADQLYLEGNVEAAEQLYRQAKRPFPEENSSFNNETLTDPERLSGAGQVYWREAQRGWDRKLEGATLVPLRLLVEEQPNFMPAHVLLIEALREFGEEEEVLPALERAVSQFPESPDLTRLQAEALADDKQYLEASIAARQFAIVYPDHPEAREFAKLADRHFSRFRRDLETQIIAAGILNVAIGGVTGQGLDRAVQLAPLLLQGESGIGSQFAAATLANSTVIDDPAIQEYVNNIGQPLAELMGRNDFDYEFHVIEDPNLNAFALPGGKIFINTGSLMAMNSEAEFAGLLGHEIAHSVLSHGFQSIVQSNLIASIGQAVPFGNLLNLAILENSRRKEQQSDIVGTRAIATAGYAADGLHTFMTKLRDQGRSNTPAYLSTHPAPDNRVRYLERIIQRNGYNRYSYEGVERHTRIKQRLKELGVG